MKRHAQRKNAGRKSVKDEFGMDPAYIEVLRPFFQFLYHVYFRVDTRGIENIPIKGPAILVANHSGGLPYDGVMIHLAVYNEHTEGRIVRFLVEDFVFDMPLLSGFVSRSGGVRACHENATKLIEKGQLIAVFPEGVKGVGKSYDERYRLQRFGRGGFVRLAMRAGAPIVPVAVIGAEEIHPIIWKSRALARPLGLPFIPFTPTFPWLGPLGLVPLPSKWRIVFGKPVSFDKFSPSDAEDDDLVDRHATRIRRTVQKMIGAELKHRKSIWV
ncbi:MAG: lysophospholipid acyltransferase family protein [Pseudomonadota bacterium]